MYLVLLCVIPRFAIAAIEGRHVLTLDIGGAFLNAYIPAGDKILVRLDQINAELLCQLRPDYRKFMDGRNELVDKLDKALFGCICSSRLWYEAVPGDKELHRG